MGAREALAAELLAAWPGLERSDAEQPALNETPCWALTRWHRCGAQAPGVQRVAAKRVRAKAPAEVGTVSAGGRPAVLLAVLHAKTAPVAGGMAGSAGLSVAPAKHPFALLALSEFAHLAG